MTDDELVALMVRKGLTIPLHTETARRLRAQMIARDARLTLLQLEQDAVIRMDENMLEARLLLARMIEAGQ